MRNPVTEIAPEDAFFDRIRVRQKAINSRLCIGLDPDVSRFPAVLQASSSPIFEFNKAIIDATADIASCFKPQIAHFAAAAAEDELLETIRYAQAAGVPVLLDGKRGDVGSTAEMYARELFERYGADAVTINPYLGQDSMQPYLDYADRGVFILCRTSNPGGADLQHLTLESGDTLYEHVAKQAATVWNGNNNVGLVVGATRPEELRRIRDICEEMTFLLPGVGAQGADISEMMGAGQGGGMLISSSRAILYAGDGEDFAEQARKVAIDTRDEINRNSN
jgi:orotidine-5'-phosphate decarboxylase